MQNSILTKMGHTHLLLDGPLQVLEQRDGHEGEVVARVEAVPERGQEVRGLELDGAGHAHVAVRGQPVLRAG